MDHKVETPQVYFLGASNLAKFTSQFKQQLWPKILVFVHSSFPSFVFFSKDFQILCFLFNGIDFPCIFSLCLFALFYYLIINNYKCNLNVFRYCFHGFSWKWFWFLTLGILILGDTDAYRCWLVHSAFGPCSRGLCPIEGTSSAFLIYTVDSGHLSWTFTSRLKHFQRHTLCVVVLCRGAKAKYIRYISLQTREIRHLVFDWSKKLKASMGWRITLQLQSHAECLQVPSWTAGVTSDSKTKESGVFWPQTIVTTEKVSIQGRVMGSPASLFFHFPPIHPQLSGLCISHLMWVFST